MASNTFSLTGSIGGKLVNFSYTDSTVEDDFVWESHAVTAAYSTLDTGSVATPDYFIIFNDTAEDLHVSLDGGTTLNFVMSAGAFSMFQAPGNTPQVKVPTGPGLISFIVTEDTP